MDVRFWAKTDTGRVREINEDNFLVDKRLQLFVVCDGMGGHAAGEVASAVCVRTVRDVVAAERDLLVHLDAHPEREDLRRQVVGVLERAIHQACARIFEMSNEDASRRGMGTTCSMLLLHGDRGFIGHVGDSRIYVVRDERVSQITEDHSLLNEMIRQGKIRPGEDANFPNKNAVTRAVGVREYVEVDAFEIEVEDGDRFLLCSDGLSGYFHHDDQIRSLLAQDNLKAITEDCVRFAHDGGGKDNITVIIVDALIEEARQRDSLEPYLDVIERTAIFEYVSPRELGSVLDLSARVEYGPGQVIAAGGQVPEMMHVILQGAVALRHDGRQIATLGAGEFFGELALIDEQVDELEVRALESTVLMAIGRVQFMDLLRTQPPLAVKLLWNLLQTFSQRLREVPAPFRAHPAQWVEVLVEQQTRRTYDELEPDVDSTMEFDPMVEIGDDEITYSVETTTQPVGPPPVQMRVGPDRADDDAEEDLRATVTLDWEPHHRDFEETPSVVMNRPAPAAVTIPAPEPELVPEDDEPTREAVERRNAAIAKLKARVMNKAISGESVSVKPRPSGEPARSGSSVVERARREDPPTLTTQKVVIAPDLELEASEQHETVELSKLNRADHE